MFFSNFLYKLLIILWNLYLFSWYFLDYMWQPNRFTFHQNKQQCINTENSALMSVSNLEDIGLGWPGSIVICVFGQLPATTSGYRRGHVQRFIYIIMASIMHPLLPLLCLPTVRKCEINRKSLLRDCNVSLHAVHIYSSSKEKWLLRMI